MSVTQIKMFNFADTGGLFDHFEVNRDSFWRKMTWLVAGSGVWHLVLVALILLIPPVRDAFSITAMFRDAGFVDRPYTKSEIEDADILDFSGEKFHYPEGYFAMDQQGIQPLPDFPVTPQFARTSIASEPSPSPTISPTPPVAIASNNIGNKTGRDKSTQSNSAASPTPNDKSIAQAQKELEAASKKTGIDLPQEGEINKAPFKALAMYATDLKNGGKLDFNKSFEIAIDTTLDSKGKLVKPTVTKKSGDETLVDLGKELISAMNDSGVLFYLKEISKDKPDGRVTFTIKQEGADVTATVETEASSADSAKRLANAFSLLLTVGAKSRAGHDEEILLKNTKVSADGTKLSFKLDMTHDAVVDIVKRGMEPEASPTVTPSKDRSD